MLLVIVLAVIASGVGAAARFRSDCDLQELQPVQIGENSFVYAADGSLLGSIPAERNRTAGRALAQISPWLRKATVAIEDKRFYEHGGVDSEGIARAVWKDVSAGQGRPGRLDDHAAARPQPLHLDASGRCSAS